jgi:hypothetical protein
MASFGMTSSAFELEEQTYWAKIPEAAKPRAFGHGAEHVRFDWTFPLEWDDRIADAMAATAWLRS